MKNQMIGGLAMLVAFSGLSQSTVIRSYEKQYQAQAKDFTLVVDNVSGEVEVEGYAGNTILLNLKIRVNGKPSEIEKAKTELTLGEYSSEGLLLLTMKAPFVDEKLEDGRMKWRSINHGPDYDYWYDFSLKVPRNTNLELRTVNDGDILVRDVRGMLKTNNVNGHIEIELANEVEKAETVNGDVNVSYAINPEFPGVFSTVNGDVVLRMQRQLNADFQAQTMNGEMYTDFEIVRIFPQGKVKVSRRGSGTMYHINDKTNLRIGEGGPDFELGTLNGDIYLKKI